MSESSIDTVWQSVDIDRLTSGKYPEIFQSWGMGIIMMFQILITVTASGTVIVMFLKVTKLRTFKNCFIANLAIADILVGCTGPISMLENLQGRWPGDGFSCQAFLAIRNSLCYMSLCSILFISADRWWSIHHPFSYRVRRSKRMAVFAIASGWILSFGINVTPMLSWELEKSQQFNLSYNQSNSTFLYVPYARETLCLHPYRKNFSFVTVSVGLEIILPLLSLILLNISVFLKIRRRKAMKIRRSLSTSEYCFHMSRKSSTDSENTTIDEDQVSASGYFRRPESKLLMYKFYKNNKRFPSLAESIVKTDNKSSHLANLVSSRKVSFDVTVLAQPMASRKSSHHISLPRNSIHRQAGILRKQSTSEELVRDLLIRQDKKAACLLGVLVLVLIFCWAPSCICSIIYSYDSSSLPGWTLIMSQWLITINSTINPFLYAIGNAEFLKVIKSWIGCLDSTTFKYQRALLYHSVQLMASDVNSSREAASLTGTTHNFSKD